METRFAATIANPLGARQESRPEASVDDVVTAVRMFSESLLTNRVSKEVQQEVEALASHMEVLISRRRQAANKSRSPSVAETQVALRNLKRFLEREANKERVKKKPSASCTTDTLESSCSHIQAFSPGTVSRTRSLRSLSVDHDVNKSAACGSRGDSAHRRPAAATAEKLRHRCCLNPASSFGSSPPMGPVPEPPQQQIHHKRRPRKERKPPPTPPSPPTPPPLNGPAHLVQLTCSDQLPLLLLVEAAEAEKEAEASSSHVHLLTEYAPPEAGAAEGQPKLQLLPAAAPDPCGCPVACVLCLCQGPAHTERAPLVTLNRQLESERPVGVAVEMAVEQPMVEAECERGSDCGKRGSSESAVKGVRGEKRAVIEEQQGNSNCASVSSHVAVVSWAKATTIVDLAAADLAAIVTARRNQWSSNQMVSTCSCPSDSDVRKASEATNACERAAKDVAEKNTEDSVELQTSSAILHRHSSIQAAPMQLEQRVCESSSPEMLVSSTSVLTVGDDPGEWQQPLFRIVDLEQLVRMAAPMARSESPTEAPGIAAASPSGVGAGVCDGNSGRSKSTLEVVDQSGDQAAEAGSASPAAPSAAAAPAAPVGLATSSVTHADPAVPGCTWSSCEVGQSSGFTKLLLTLDKAAKRRRELARASKRSRQKQQRTALNEASAAAASAAATRGRRTSRSGNNSSRLRSQQHHQQTPPTQTLTLTPPAPSARRQEEALKLAARSLAGLARSLQLCVRRVYDAADAINCTL